MQGLLDRKQVKQITKYLFQDFGSNATLAVGSNGKEEIFFNNSKNKYPVFFRIYKYSDIYWDGIKIDFFGHNDHQFYKVIVANQVNWKVLNHQKDSRLSHLDLCYLPKKTNDKINFESFLKQYYNKIARNKAIKNISLQQNSPKWIFKIAKRESPNYYHVYQNQTRIKFELEQRGATIKRAQKLIFQDRIEEFERVMAEKFFNHSKRIL